MKLLYKENYVLDIFPIRFCILSLIRHNIQKKERRGRQKIYRNRAYGGGNVKHSVAVYVKLVEKLA